jgi:Matrixin
LSQALRVLFLTYIVLILASCAKPKAQKDCGFVQNVYGERVSWKQTVPVHMYLHTSVPSTYESSIRAAADSWNKAERRELIVIESARVGGSGPARDGKNVIYMQYSWEADRASEQARTSLYWVGDQIQEADIRINGQNYTFYVTQSSSTTQAVSMQALLLHELGHVIGLRHNDASPSVMATYLKANQERTQLQSADLSSLQCEY